jgi:hypothetical protein
MPYRAIRYNPSAKKMSPEMQRDMSIALLNRQIEANSPSARTIDASITHEIRQY